MKKENLFRVVAHDYSEIFIDETEALEEYQEIIADIEQEENDNGFVELYFRSSIQKDWSLVKQFALGDELNELNEDSDPVLLTTLGNLHDLITEASNLTDVSKPEDESKEELINIIKDLQDVISQAMDELDVIYEE